MTLIRGGMRARHGVGSDAGSALEIARRPWLQVAAFTVAGLLDRLDGLSYVSVDMSSFLLPWFDEIRQGGGLHALRSQIGDYGVPYQTIIALFTYLPFNPVLMYKVLSICFDFVLAAAAALLTHAYCRREWFVRPYVATYAVVMLSPLVVWNSSVWGQCDSVYTAFCVITVLLYERRHPYWAFLAFGFAFAFKLQSVFLLPYLGYRLLRDGRWRNALGVLLVPAPLVLLSVPAMLFGRPVGSVLDNYLHQVSEYKAMYIDAPSLWAFGTNDMVWGHQEAYWEASNKYAVLLALVVLALMLTLELLSERRRSIAYSPLMVAYLSAHACVLLLPSMHERYAYLAEILVVVLAVVDRAFLPSAVVLPVASMICYGQALYGMDVNIILVTFLSAGGLLYALHVYLGKYGWKIRD